MISIKQLSYRIGQKSLLHNINLELNAGEMLAIIGANGAGKSTLMKLLCRDIHPTQGEILLKEQPIESYKIMELARIRAVLAQQNTISMAFTVQELVSMGRYPHYDGQPTAHDQDIVKTVMEETGITHLAGRQYNTLSGGEQQRTQLARVMAQIWDVPNGLLFLDEPTNGLDLLYQQQVLSVSRKMANNGFCVVCILHDINFASRYADKILILKEGKSIAFGPPKDVINCENIHEAFRIKVHLMNYEDFQCPLVIPGIYESKI